MAGVQSIRDVPDWVVLIGAAGLFRDTAKTADWVSDWHELRDRQKAYLDEHGLGHLGYFDIAAERHRRRPAVKDGA